MTVTLKDFQAFAEHRLLQGFKDPPQFAAKLKEVFDFAIENESSMDAEANAYFEKILDGIATTFEHGLTGIADSPDKRRMLRLVALTKHKHHRAENFLKGLGRPLHTPFAVAEVGRPIFLEAQQSVLDLLFDVTRKSQTGVAQFATLSMLYWTVDELTVAFYLAERKYATQAYSHLRTVHDLLDKAELLFRYPQWAELWRSDNKKKISSELSPGAVRLKLGKPKFDAVYDFLTERGMHGTLGAVKKRVVQRGDIGGGGHVAMWIGGVAWDEEVEIVVSFCIFSVLLVLNAVARTYGDRLHPIEVSTILETRSDAAREFLQSYLVRPLQLSGDDVLGVIDALKVFTQSKTPVPMPKIAEPMQKEESVPQNMCEIKTREEAWQLLTEFTQSESLRKHALAVEACMRACAGKFGDASPEAVTLWGIVGLIHDFDYEQYPSLEDHPYKGNAILQERGWPDEIMRAIMSHAEYTGVTRDTALEKALFACDELAGFITAVALIKPGKSLAEVDAKSVRKRMKDKAFARKVNRDDIIQGAAALGVDLDEHIAFCIEALKPIAKELGLDGSAAS